MAKIVRLLFTLLVSCCVCEAYKILVIFPLPFRSHTILGNGVVRHLVNAGHEVTYITPSVRKDAPKNLRYIDISNIITEPEKLLNIEDIMQKKIDPGDYETVMRMSLYTSMIVITSEQVQKILNDPKENFDLIIAEWMFNELYTGLAPVFDAPFIWVSTIEPHWLVLSLIDDVLNPAFNENSMSTNIAPFTFWQRLEELWVQIRVSYLRYFTFIPESEAAYEKLLAPIIAKRGKQPPSFTEVMYNVSLILGNSHPSMGQATRLPQNYKAIGGYHIEDPEPLPEDLKKIMDESKNGVVYFSMGSNLKSKEFPAVLKKGLLKIFGGLKQTVLWKFEEVLPDLPKNVHVLKWAPQSSILAHPNCVLFITHGGLLSTAEAIHHGVPIIGIPVFGDQFINTRRAVNKGFALKVDLSLTMIDELKAATDEILNNPKFTEKVKELSLVYHHRQSSPGADLVHWVEHVIVTKGAPHLRSPALLVPWYQKMYLDLLALILVIIILLYTLISKALSAIFTRKVDRKKKNK